jgi:hypothetical protein
MIAQPIIRAIDASGNTVSESMFGASEITRIPYLCRLVGDRLTLSGRPFVRLVVDMAISPEEGQQQAQRPVQPYQGPVPLFDLASDFLAL